MANDSVRAECADAGWQGAVGVLQHDFEQSVGYWLVTTAHLYQRVLNEQLAPCGITYRQCQTLGWLALDGPLSQAELAERMGIEPPTLVGILDRMERDGWIRRVACPDDRRRKLIHPTDEAEPVWTKILECARTVRQRALAGLTSEQAETLRQLLKLVRENLSAEVSVEEMV